MTTDATPLHNAARIPWPFVELFRREPIYASTALCLAALVLPTSLALALDDRTLLGSNVWIKPLKFEISLAIYTATLAWFAGWLPKSTTTSRWYRVFTLLVVLCIAAEMTWIGGAAAFGVASHFNTSSQVMASLYGFMGIIAILLTSSSLVFGVLILRDTNSRLEPAFRVSVGLGLVLTFILTIVVAGYMATSTGHAVEANLSDANGSPLMGWSRDGGDLRVPHFFATHAMHVVPLFGFAAACCLPPRSACVAALTFAAAFTSFVALTFAGALSGRPFPIAL